MRAGYPRVFRLRLNGARRPDGELGWRLDECAVLGRLEVLATELARALTAPLRGLSVELPLPLQLHFPETRRGAAYEDRVTRMPEPLVTQGKPNADTVSRSAVWRSATQLVRRFQEAG